MREQLWTRRDDVSALENTSNTHALKSKRNHFKPLKIFKNYSKHNRLKIRNAKELQLTLKLEHRAHLFINFLHSRCQISSKNNICISHMKTIVIKITSSNHHFTKKLATSLELTTLGHINLTAAFVQVHFLKYLLKERQYNIL